MQPHVHLPGGYWMATCDHLQSFLPPQRHARSKKCEGKEEYTMVFEAQAPMYEKLCAPDWCLGILDYESDHWIGSHPGSRFAVCPPEMDECHPLAQSDVTWTFSQQLPRETRVQLEFCQSIRTAYDYERWMLRETNALMQAQ